VPRETTRETAKSTPDLQGQIRRRAYELYEQRGREDGFALDDWLQAEGEILGGQKKASKRNVFSTACRRAAPCKCHCNDRKRADRIEPKLIHSDVNSAIIGNRLLFALHGAPFFESFSSWAQTSRRRNPQASISAVVDPVRCHIPRGNRFA